MTFSQRYWAHRRYWGRIESMRRTLVEYTG